MRVSNSFFEGLLESLAACLPPRVKPKHKKKKYAKWQLTTKQVHGKALEPRWDGNGPVPIGIEELTANKPLFERTHPYHTKIHPAIGIGTRGNHDASSLVTLLNALLSNDGKLDDEVVDSLIAEMSRDMNNANFYCADYPCKQQPHIQNLFLSFAEGLRQLEP